ncbi:MAG: peptidoglycan editing factor PgeF [Sandaracinaceae bacterium]
MPSGGIEVLRSELLSEHGFLHAFSTREGGVSEGPFASLNLARTVDDDPAAVAANTARFAEELGAHDHLYEVSQVHGARVVDASGDVMALREEEADAIVARTPGAAVAVRTADCVPILLADPRTGAVAAVHAGWRGVVADIASAAVRAMESDELLAVIGPHIRLPSFEVSDEIADRIEAAAGERVIDRSAPRPHADLAAAVRAQLRRAGVAAIDDVGGDTFDEARRFFSHRRDQGRTGRHLSAIVARG